MDPLSFVDLKAIRSNQSSSAKTGQRDAVRTGHAYIHAPSGSGSHGFSFLGGSTVRWLVRKSLERVKQPKRVIALHHR